MEYTHANDYNPEIFEVSEKLKHLKAEKRKLQRKKRLAYSALKLDNQLLVKRCRTLEEKVSILEQWLKDNSMRSSEYLPYWNEFISDNRYYETL